MQTIASQQIAVAQIELALMHDRGKLCSATNILRCGSAKDRRKNNFRRSSISRWGLHAEGV
jgi:transposase-like protein